MKNRIFLLLSILILISSMILTGCWNYREVEKLTIVAGVAIDKGKNSKYQITTEIIEISGGKEVKPSSRLITMEGNTIFDAVRNEISLAGKKLYWAHTKVVILSKEIASEGTLSVVDWINRDSETRADVLLLVSREKTAKEIFNGRGITNQIVSFELSDILKNESSLSKAPVIEVSDFVNRLESRGIAAVLPVVQLKKNIKQQSPQIMGTAIFNKDKLIGFLKEEETKYLLFVLDKIKGGLLISNGQNRGNQTPVSLEIFKSKTKTVPLIKNNHIEFNIQINTTVVLDEISKGIKTLDEKTIKQLEHKADSELKHHVEKLIKHVQTSYGVDVFGFGEKLHEEYPKVWKRVADNWETEYFKKLPVNVNVKIKLKGSGMMSKTID